MEASATGLNVKTKPTRKPRPSDARLGCCNVIRSASISMGRFLGLDGRGREERAGGRQPLQAGFCPSRCANSCRSCAALGNRAKTSSPSMAMAGGVSTPSSTA